MAKIKETYNNLIDVCIILEEKPEYTGKAKEIFKNLLTDYFFKLEIGQSKSLEFFFGDFPMPEFLADKQSLLGIPIDDLKHYINGNSINDSLAGKIMLSNQYLKSFYPHHVPSFSKLPEDVKFELIDKIKEKNKYIISAFEKMNLDGEADRKRKIITLVALIMKNICRKTGRPLGKLNMPVEELIRKTYNIADEVFNGSQRQIAELGDDIKIKELIKAFFTIRQFSEINELAKIYRDELTRYKKRGIKTGSK